MSGRVEFRRYDVNRKKTEDQIVRALRNCGKGACKDCAYRNEQTSGCYRKHREDAADLIEALMKANRDKDKHLKEAQERIRQLQRMGVIEE